MPLFVVCIPASGEGVVSSSPPCVDADGVHLVPVQMELAAPGAINFDNSELLFAYSLTAVLTFWALGVGVGVVLSLLRRET